MAALKYRRGAGRLCRCGQFHPGAGVTKLPGRVEHACAKISSPHRPVAEGLTSTALGWIGPPVSSLAESSRVGGDGVRTGAGPCRISGGGQSLSRDTLGGFLTYLLATVRPIALVGVLLRSQRSAPAVSKSLILRALMGYPCPDIAKPR